MPFWWKIPCVNNKSYLKPQPQHHLRATQEEGSLTVHHEVRFVLVREKGEPRPENGMHTMAASKIGY
ncbi:hypothetical protein Pelo_10666 [Pelomyxa schiedti]|nr:hypothetical protein Pelo_10666 [Pelomyxa schiedti]